MKLQNLGANKKKHDKWDTPDMHDKGKEGLVHLYGQNFGRTKKVGCRGL